MSMPPTGDRLFRGDVIRLSELTVNTSTIEGLEFSNCKILGPAVLALLTGVSATGCTWDAPTLEAMFWIVDPPRQVVGAIGAVDCSFSNCRFQEVGVAGPRDLYDSFVNGFQQG